MTTPAKSNGHARLSPAERQARWRRRQRSGAIILRVEISPAEIEALIRAQRISEDQALDPDRLADAVTGVLRHWARHWLVN